MRPHVGAKSTFNGGENNICFLFLVGSSPPVPIIAPTSPRGPLTAQTVPIIGPKRGQLFDYGRVLGARAGPMGWILAIVSAFQHFIQVQVVEQCVIFN